MDLRGLRGCSRGKKLDDSMLKSFLGESKVNIKDVCMRKIIVSVLDRFGPRELISCMGR